MITLFARLHVASAPQRGFRLLWLAVLFGLVVGGIPRWEVHQHELAGHAHFYGHHHASISADGDATQAVSPDSDTSVTHGHATPSIPVVLIEPELPVFDGLARRVPDFPATDLLAPACCWPPPFRPPIV